MLIKITYPAGVTVVIPFIYRSLIMHKFETKSLIYRCFPQSSP
jgi:hypothetical protein